MSAVLTWPILSAIVVPLQRPPQRSFCATAAPLPTPTSATQPRKVTVCDDLDQSDQPQQLQMLYRCPLSSAASIKLHPGATPGRTAGPRWRKSSTATIAQHTTAYCVDPSLSNLAISLSIPLPTCGILKCISLLQGPVSSPVALVSLNVQPRASRTNCAVLVRE